MLVISPELLLERLMIGYPWNCTCMESIAGDVFTIMFAKYPLTGKKADDNNFRWGWLDYQLQASIGISRILISVSKSGQLHC